MRRPSIFEFGRRTIKFGLKDLDLRMPANPSKNISPF